MIHFNLPKSLVDRESYILNTARGKSVLHLGCADYPFTEERIANGSWLHSKISSVSKSCVGFDLDAVTVNMLRDRYKVESLIVGDAEKLYMLAPQKFELIIAGELIEHLNNPGLFLESARKVLKPRGMLIITTANAFCLRRMMRVPFGTESVHPDHTYYFSHTTLRTLVQRFGYVIIDAASYRLPNRRPILPYIVERMATWVSPNLGEGVVHTYMLNDSL